MSTHSQPRGAVRRLWLPILAILAFAGLIVASVLGFESPSDSRAQAGDPNLSDGIQVGVQVVNVVPDQDHANIRMSFEPVGNYSAGRHTLTKPVRVTVHGGAETFDEKFQAGEHIAPENITVALEGDIGQYPLDSYDGTFEVSVRDAEGAEIPSVLLADTSVHGYSVRVSDPFSEVDAGNGVTLIVQRSKANLGFSFFIMGLMWALTVLAIVMAAGEIRSDRPVDTPVISFLGVLLFAFPSIRNSMPNAPSVGVLSDFICYLWCEIALGLTLVVLLATAVRRRLAADAAAPAE